MKNEINFIILNHQKAMIEIFTDGSCIVNKRVGGWAFIIAREKIENCVVDYGSEINTTNNRMEMTAILKALEYIERNQRIDKTLNGQYITIYTDSRYAGDGIKKIIKGDVWWRSSKVPNPDLWEALKTVICKVKGEIFVEWVEAHTTKKDNKSKFNSYVDFLANKQAKERCFC